MEEIIEALHECRENNDELKTQINIYSKISIENSKKINELTNKHNDLEYALYKIRTIAFKHGFSDIINICNPLLPFNQGGEPINQK